MKNAFAAILMAVSILGFMYLVVTSCDSDFDKACENKAFKKNHPNLCPTDN